MLDKSKILTEMDYILYGQISKCDVNKLSDLLNLMLDGLERKVPITSRIELAKVTMMALISAICIKSDYTLSMVCKMMIRGYLGDSNIITSTMFFDELLLSATKAKFSVP